MSYCGKNKSLLRLNVEGKLTCDQEFFFSVGNVKVGGREEKGTFEGPVDSWLKENPFVELRWRIKSLSYSRGQKNLRKVEKPNCYTQFCS